jgi:hypothetical protein
MKRKQIFYAAIATIALIILFFSFQKNETDFNQIYARVQRGPFESLIFSSGQLESENSENIYIPEKLKDRTLRIIELTITDLVDEGLMSIPEIT